MEQANQAASETYRLLRILTTTWTGILNKECDNTNKEVWLWQRTLEPGGTA